MSVERLEATARALVSPGKGILAADESHPSIARRFEPLGIPNSEDTRRRYRQMLSPRRARRTYISGVILFDETIRQKADDGTPLVEVLVAPGHHPRHQGGSRREGRWPAPRREGDRRPRRLARAARRVPALGARFAKWRAVINIGTGLPTDRHRGECPRAGALRRAVPGGGAGADRGAGSADGRGPHHRALRRGDRATLHAVFDALHAQGVRSRACCSSRTW